MKRLILASTIAGGMLLAGTGDAYGHGGQYRGPGDTVPPSEGPGPGTGGPGTGGPGTGGPGGPQTPGGGRGPTTPGGGLGVPGGGGPSRGPTTPGGGAGGRKNRPAEGFEQWQFWWEYNKDPYLDLKARLGMGAVESGTTGFLLGSGRRVEADTAKRLSPSEVNSMLVPVLKSVLNETDADIVDSAVLALGRSVRTDSASLVFEDIKNTLRNSNPTVKQSSILSLGVLGSKEALPLLIEIMKDSPEGRRLVDERGSIGSIERAFAALSLGFIGAEETIPVLQEVVTDARDTSIDLKAGAILALGLFTDGRDGIVKFLADQLKDQKMNELVQAQVPISLGRLGEAAEPVLPELLKLVKGKKTSNQVRRSSIVALGQIAQPQDKEVFDALFATVADENDDQSRHYALISIAQIGARAAKDAEKNGDLVRGLMRDLMKELAKGRQPHRPWVGLSLALIGREMNETSPDRMAITQKILEEFENDNNNSHKSAHAIALGLLNARSAAKSLYETMLDKNDLNLQGYIAVSLGMMRHTDSLDTLRKKVLDDRDEKFRVQVATALGLMGDVQAVDTLVQALKGAKTLSEVSSIAKALGLISDRSAVQPLTTLVQDSKAPGLARGFGCVSLGLIGEKTELPWNAPISVNSNYRTVIGALYEVLDIL